MGEDSQETWSQNLTTITVNNGKVVRIDTHLDDSTPPQPNQPLKAANPPISYASAVGAKATATKPLPQKKGNTPQRSGLQIPRRSLKKMLPVLGEVIGKVGGVFRGFSGDLFAPSDAHCIQSGLSFPPLDTTLAHETNAKTNGSRFWALPPLYGQGALTNAECAGVIQAALSSPNFLYGVLVTPAPAITDILPAEKLGYYMGDIPKVLAGDNTYRGSITLTTPTNLLHLLPPADETPAVWTAINSPPLPLQFHIFVKGEQTPPPKHAFAQETPLEIVALDANPVSLPLGRAGMFCLPGTVWGKGALKTLLSEHVSVESIELHVLPSGAEYLSFPEAIGTKIRKLGLPVFCKAPVLQDGLFAVEAKLPPNESAPEALPALLKELPNALWVFPTGKNKWRIIMPRPEVLPNWQKLESFFQMRLFVPRPLWNNPTIATAVKSKLNEPHITLTGIPLAIAAERLVREIHLLNPLANNNVTFLLDPSIPSAPCTRGVHLFSLPSFSADDQRALRATLNCYLEQYEEPQAELIENELQKLWDSYK